MSRARLDDLVLAAGDDLAAQRAGGQAQQRRRAVGAACRMRLLHRCRGGVTDRHLPVGAAAHEAHAVRVLGVRDAAGAAPMPRFEFERFGVCHGIGDVLLSSQQSRLITAKLSIKLMR